MATEVLLMENVADLGSEGDVVSVADGYARNYLLPKNLAAPVTDATRRRLAKLQKERATERQKAVAEAKTLAEKLESLSCTIPVRTGDEYKLYGSVTASDIAKSLADQGVEIDRHLIDLEAPIKELGIFEVKARLDPDVTATIKVWVVEE